MGDYMKNKKRLNRILAVLFISLTMCSILNSILAAINPNYEKAGYVEDSDLLDNSVEESSVLNEIGKFIFAVANLIERIVSRIMGMLTQDEFFPWADTVIFNAVPMLDVNFLNPDPNSLLSMTSSVGFAMF